MMQERTSRLRTEQLGNDTLDAASLLNSEGVAAIGGDELVGGLHARLHSDGHSFLSSAVRGLSACMPPLSLAHTSTYLTNGKVAEAPDEFLLVELVRCHFHPAHLDHLRVQAHEVLLARLDLERGNLVLVAVERLGGQLHRKGRVGCVRNARCVR